MTAEKKNKSGDLRVTHLAPANWWSLFSYMVSVVAHICFCDGRTDILRENNDHLFGRGLVGQQDLRIQWSTRTHVALTGDFALF